MRPRVSVVIPTYNRSGALDRTIRSVLAQTERDLEIIVVDDGSTDDTPGVLARYGSQLRVIRQRNAGAGAARNAGIEAARAPFVAFLDDDDVWLPEKTREQLALFDQHPDAALVSTGAQFVEETGRLQYVQGWSLGGRRFRKVLFHNPIVTSSVIVRRSCLHDLTGLFRTDLAPVEDWEMWIRIAARHEIVVSPRPLVRYSASPTGAFRKTDPEQSLAIYLNLYEGLRLDPVAGPEVRRQWRRILAHVHYLAGVKRYGMGDGSGARAQLLQAIREYPWKVRWRTVATMLLLPVKLREAMRYWVTRGKAP